MNPYIILGVEPGATDEDIKKAYRKRSSEAHPDKNGGSSEAQQEVNDAYAVLSDPARRAEYDATGSIKAPQDIDAEAINVLLNLVSSLLKVPPGRLIEAAKEAIRNMQGQASSQLQQNEVTREGYVKRKSRLRVKDGRANFIEGLLNQHIDAIDNTRPQIENQLAVMTRALEILDDFSEDSESFSIYIGNCPPSTTTTTFYLGGT